MGKLKLMTESELLATFCLCLLDKGSICVLGRLTTNDEFQQTAPRLADWLTGEFTNEIERRENGIEGSPAPLDLDDWSDAQIGEALAGCLLLRRAVILPMQDEFVSLLKDVVSTHAIVRLKFEAEAAQWS